MKKWMLRLSILFLIALSYFNAHACTDFRITAKDTTTLIARSMEFSIDLQSNVRTSVRGRAYTSTLANGKSGLAWKAKYGYVFVDGMNQDFAIDGMNEQGLSFEYLYLPGETQYQIVPAGKESRALPYLMFGDWVLSNFKTVDEVRAALANIFVYQQTIPGMGNMIFPLHAAIYDPSGKGLVVEFVNGRISISDNLVGVMTNSPVYAWHITNLRNYLNLSPYNPKPIVENGLTFTATGQGAGMLGLPGDISPPARFAKISFLLKSAYPVNNAVDALNLAQHIINNVDIPAGLARAITNGTESSEKTEWVVFKDLTHRMFYYRTYNDLTIRAIDLSKLDFNPTAARLLMPMAQAPSMIDMTAKFLTAK